MSAFRTTRLLRTRPGAVDPWHLARIHAPDLAEAARQVLAVVPDAKLCGVVVAPGADIGVALRALLWQNHGGHDERTTCVGVVGLDDLRVMLRGEPSAVAVLAHAHAATKGTLPVLVASPEGLRSTAIATGAAVRATG